MRPEEVENVISRTLQSNAASQKVVVSPAVLREIVKIARGFPAVVHRLCYEAYRKDSDDVLDEDDLDYAKKEYVTRIQANELSKLLDKAGTGDYRKIILAMAQREETDIKLKDIGEMVGRPSNELSSYMSRLVNDDIIIRSDRALYRFREPLLKLFVQYLIELQPDAPFGQTDS